MQNSEDIQIFPPCWFTGMADSVLQLIIYDCNVASASLSTTIPHTSAKRIDTDSPNYIIVEITLSSDIAPGRYQIAVGERVISYLLEPKRPWRPTDDTVNATDTIYLLMPDRFAAAPTAAPLCDTDRRGPEKRHGGNLAGIESHAEYIASLGATAVWITPYVENAMPPAGKDGEYASYHGYSATNHYMVDPHFGTLADAAAMNRALHHAGMKVVMDLVLNHVGAEHLWVKDEPVRGWINRPASRRLTNYNVTPALDPYTSAADLADTVDGWFTDSMADVNLRNPDLLRYYVQMAVWWVEKTLVDAFRIDTFPYVPLSAAAEWLRRIQREYPGLSVIAEAWNISAAYTGRLQNEIYQRVGHCSFVVMDFAFQDAMTRAFRDGNATAIYNHFAHDFVYRYPRRVMAFLDNHDIRRWLSAVPGERLLRVAIGVLLTAPRIPQIYYGTEIMLDSSPVPDCDGFKRKDFPGGFPGDGVSKFAAAGRTPQENRIFRFVRALLRWRRRNNAAVSGRMVHYLPQANGVYVYFRHSRRDAASLMVIVNLSRRTVSLDLSRYATDTESAQSFTDILSGRGIHTHAGRLTLQPESIRLLSFCRLPLCQGESKFQTTR